MNQPVKRYGLNKVITHSEEKNRKKLDEERLYELTPWNRNTGFSGRARTPSMLHRDVILGAVVEADSH